MVLVFWVFTLQKKCNLIEFPDVAGFILESGMKPEGNPLLNQNAPLIKVGHCWKSGQYSLFL